MKCEYCEAEIDVSKGMLYYQEHLLLFGCRKKFTELKNKPIMEEHKTLHQEVQQAIDQIQDFADRKIEKIKREFSQQSKQKKERIPLFVSDDGVPMLVGDNYYTAWGDGGITKQTVYERDSPNTNSAYPRFSTKYKAEQWHEKHKPKFSEQDIADAINKSCRASGTDIGGDYMFIDTNNFYEKLNIK